MVALKPLKKDHERVPREGKQELRGGIETEIPALPAIAFGAGSRNAVVALKRLQTHWCGHLSPEAGTPWWH